MDEKTVRIIREAEEEARDAERTVKDQILELEREIEVADRRIAALNGRMHDALDRAMQAERYASIFAARAERAEAELAAQRAMYDSLGPDWSHAPDDNPPPTHYVIDATGTAQWLWAMRGDVDALIEPIRNSGAWLLRNVYRTEAAALLDLPLGVDWRLCKWTRPSNNESEG